MSRKKKNAAPEEKKRLALIRIRGKVHVRSDIEETLGYLNLKNINNCAIIDNRPEYKGMLQKVKDYITWGEINTETLEKLLKERGRLPGKKLEEAYLKDNTEYATLNQFSDAYLKFNAELKDIPEIKPSFKLSPPKGGHERKGIKQPYSLGGVLGYRGEGINELIERMI